MDLNDPKRTTWAYDYVEREQHGSSPSDFNHHSYNAHRLDDSPLEAQALAVWINYNKRLDVLGHILSDEENTAQPEKLSQRDLEVAATVIQWLGSPVGQSFLRDSGLKDG